MSEIKLKPCPFCGGEVYIEDLGVEKGDHYYMLQCTNEDCDAATSFGEKNKKDFIKAWNTRNPVDDVLEQIELNAELFSLSDRDCCFAIRQDKALEIVKEVMGDD